MNDIRNVFKFLEKNKGIFFTAKQLIIKLKGKASKAQIYRALDQIMSMDEYEKDLNITEHEYNKDSLYTGKVDAIMHYRRKK